MNSIERQFEIQECCLFDKHTQYLFFSTIILNDRKYFFLQFVFRKGEKIRTNNYIAKKTDLEQFLW